MTEATSELITRWHGKVKDRDGLSEAKRQISKKYGIGALLNSEILEGIREMKAKNSLPKGFDEEFWLHLLRKRAIRTLSGVAPVAILTKPYPCPGHCAYCPNEKDVPASYLPNEPAVMRAIACRFDPYRQTILRLYSLENNGHRPNKIEIIVIGGTWSYLPDRYQYWYILNCFRAANDFSRIRSSRQIWSRLENGGDSKFQISKTDFSKIRSPYPKNLPLSDVKEALKKEQAKNEKADYKIIGLTLETRPDYIDEKEAIQMRELGCTRVELGVQAPDDKILSLNRRGHGVKEIIEASRLLRDYGFKITYHIMPALPGSTPARDFKMFESLFSDGKFQPDQIKFYPTVVTAGSLLYRWWKEGRYKPYSDKQLQNLIISCKASIPDYVRIIRLIRDIPGESILAGNKVTNLRQVMQQRGVVCHCIRCREPKDASDIKAFDINIESYDAGEGKEYFISADSKDRKTIFGFCRLRIKEDGPVAPSLIRELHVYGELVPVGSGHKVQHRGIGAALLREAEKIVSGKGISKIAIISGVGARDYYRRSGYRLKGTYMVKNLK